MAEISSVRVLTLARDVRLHQELYPDQDADADLHGRVIDKFGRSANVKFLLLQDPSERIQVLLVRADLPVEIWDSYIDLVKGQAVRVRGLVGLAKSGKLSVIPTMPVEPLDIGNAKQLGGDMNGVGSQIILARLENRCREYLTAAGFEEIAPRFLSSVWPEGGLQALHVQFPGQSKVPFYLAVSPHPQLLRALVSTGNSRLFTISRSFATNFIATQNGAEYSIASFVTEERDVRRASENCVDLVISMVEGYETGLDNAGRVAWNSASVTWSESAQLSPPPRQSDGLSVHIYKPLSHIPGPLDVAVTRTFNLLWNGYLTIAEGFAFALGGADYVAITIHIERFLKLLGTGDNRRIANLFSLRAEECT